MKFTERGRVVYGDFMSGMIRKECRGGAAAESRGRSRGVLYEKGVNEVGVLILFSIFPTEKRAKYDSGEDPLDPEAQGGGGHQWHHGGFPFGEGFQFKFHFN